MKQLKTYTIIGILFVLIAGSLAHFLYGWSGGNFIVGFFAPVNESVWEHMKLLFFPMLAYSLIMGWQCKASCPCVASSLCFGILAGTFSIPALFYAYTYLLGKTIFLLDIAIFFFSAVLAFWAAYKFTISCKAEPYAHLLCRLVYILLICFMVFTYFPPALGLFEAPTASQNK